MTCERMSVSTPWVRIFGVTAVDWPIFVTSNAVWVGSSSELHVTAAGPLMRFDLGFRDISSFQNYKNYGLNEIKIQIN